MSRFIKLYFYFFLLFSSVMVFGQTYPERPNPPRLVNDFTGTLTGEQVQALERKLVLLEMNDVPYASHLGYQKTVTMVRKEYF